MVTTTPGDFFFVYSLGFMTPIATVILTVLLICAASRAKRAVEACLARRRRKRLEKQVLKATARRILAGEAITFQTVNETKKVKKSVSKTATTGAKKSDTAPSAPPAQEETSVKTEAASGKTEATSGKTEATSSKTRATSGKSETTSSSSAYDADNEHPKKTKLRRLYPNLERDDVSKL